MLLLFLPKILGMGDQTKKRVLNRVDGNLVRSAVCRMMPLTPGIEATVVVRRSTVIALDLEIRGVKHIDRSPTITSFETEGKPTRSVSTYVSSVVDRGRAGGISPCTGR